jgi:hypothetical protein
MGPVAIGVIVCAALLLAHSLFSLYIMLYA